MVSFVCDVCQETLKKKVLDQHKQRSGHSQFTCIDCNTTFSGTQYRAHTECISEAEKYQGKLYKDKKKAIVTEPKVQLNTVKIERVNEAQTIQANPEQITATEDKPVKETEAKLIGNKSSKSEKRKKQKQIGEIKTTQPEINDHVDVEMETSDVKVSENENKSQITTPPNEINSEGTIESNEISPVETVDKKKRKRENQKERKEKLKIQNKETTLDSKKNPETSLEFNADSIKNELIQLISAQESKCLNFNSVRKLALKSIVKKYKDSNQNNVSFKKVLAESINVKLVDGNLIFAIDEKLTK